MNYRLYQAITQNQSNAETGIPEIINHCIWAYVMSNKCGSKTNYTLNFGRDDPDNHQHPIRLSCDLIQYISDAWTSNDGLHQYLLWGVEVAVPSREPGWIFCKHEVAGTPANPNMTRMTIISCKGCHGSSSESLLELLPLDVIKSVMTFDPIAVRQDESSVMFHSRDYPVDSPIIIRRDILVKSGLPKYSTLNIIILDSVREISDDIATMVRLRFEESTKTNQDDDEMFMKLLRKTGKAELLGYYLALNEIIAKGQP